MRNFCSVRHYRYLLVLQEHGLNTKREAEKKAAAAFVEVNDEHQKPQWRGKNKQVVNQCHTIKAFWRKARPGRTRVSTRVEYYCSGWLVVTCEAIIETRSAQGMDCNNATHAHSLIMPKHTHLPPPLFLLRLLLRPRLSPCLSLTRRFHTRDQFVPLFLCFYRLEFMSCANASQTLQNMQLRHEVGSALCLIHLTLNIYMSDVTIFLFSRWGDQPEQDKQLSLFLIILSSLCD